MSKRLWQEAKRLWVRNMVIIPNSWSKLLLPWYVGILGQLPCKNLWCLYTTTQITKKHKRNLFAACKNRLSLRVTRPWCARTLNSCLFCAAPFSPETSSLPCVSSACVALSRQPGGHHHYLYQHHHHHRHRHHHHPSPLIPHAWSASQTKGIFPAALSRVSLCKVPGGSAADCFPHRNSTGKCLGGWTTHLNLSETTNSDQCDFMDPLQVGWNWKYGSDRTHTHLPTSWSPIFLCRW